MSQSPPCYGTNLWSATASECVGGVDPGYTHPITRSHNRERCNWFSQCASMRGSFVTQQPQQRSYAPVLAPPRPPQMMQNPQHFQPYPPPPPALYSGQQFISPYIAQFGPPTVPAPYQQPGAQIPAYLTIQEPINLNEPWFPRLIREIVRAMMKATGHSIANFFDHNPMRAHKPPEQK